MDFSQIALCVVLAALILITVSDVLSRVVYGRTIISTLAELILLLGRKARTSEQAEKELAVISESDEKPYTLPEKLSFRVSVERSDFNGMPVITLNGEGKGASVLYLHGGGYVHNPLALHYTFLDKLAKKTDCRVIIPIYPKAPKHSFKESYSLLAELSSDVFARADSVIMGDSSGGGLALGLCEYLKQEKLPLPEKAVLFAPWVDLTMQNPLIPEYEKVDPRNSAALAKVWAEAWADGTDLTDYRLSPVYGDLSGLGQVHIFIGTRDLLYPDCVSLHEKLDESGTQNTLIVGKGLNHVYPIFPTPEGHAALRQVAEIIGSPYDASVEDAANTADGYPQTN